jgi:hypothetical protein
LLPLEDPSSTGTASRAWCVTGLLLMPEAFSRMRAQLIVGFDATQPRMKTGPEKGSTAGAV